MANNIFNTVEFTRPDSNSFDLTHDVKMSCKMGEIVPMLALECIPGDKVTLGCDSLIRFAPLLAPIMHRVDVTMHYFFVPHRIVWDNWEAFITQDSAVPAVMPYLPVNSASSADIKRFLDYFGIPPIAGPRTYNINALPIAGYQKIYNEYYRDQNLVSEVESDLVDGNNSGNLDLLVMRHRAYEHDYFTSSLPFAQKGTAVAIPLGDVSLITGWDADGTRPKFVDAAMNPVAGPANIQAIIAGANGPWIQEGGSGSGISVALDPNGSLTVEATTINDLRTAMRLQEWLERNAVGGTRYVEHILAHFGVRSSDKRLQRPEYIVGVKAPAVISEVLNSTGPTEFFNGTDTEQTGSAQGTMAGHGVSVSSGKNGTYYCEEHGYVIGVMTCMPKTAYQQGIPKHFLKNDFTDYFFPKFAHLGEQPILQAEIYADTASPTDTFGYTPRYAEYKYIPSRVAGDFRTTLNYWHLGRIFSSEPALTQEFIECLPEDAERIFAVQDGSDYLWCHVLHRIHASRLMPYYGTPRL